MPIDGRGRRVRLRCGEKAYRSWNSLRGLVCDLYLAGYSARAAHRLSYLSSPLGHGKGLGPSVFYRFDIPVLLALPPLLLRALRSLSCRPVLWLGIGGALIQAGFHMWDQRVFAIPNRASWAARFGFYLFAGMLAGLDFDVLQDWTRRNRWAIAAVWAVSAVLNCSVSAAIR